MDHFRMSRKKNLEKKQTLVNKTNKINIAKIKKNLFFQSEYFN